MKLKEFAQSLGLSQTTVSRALNGYPEVSEVTRRRVLQAAKKHNYRPNTRAKALATGQSMSIGHVISYSSRRLMISPIFAEFIAGASDVYSSHGYDIQVLFVREEDEEIAFRDMAATGSVDGIVVHGPKVGDRRIDLITSLGIPFIVHGRSTGITTPYSWVDVNSQRAFRHATDFLVNLGHLRIGFVNGPEIMDFATRRRAGYLAALSAHGIEPDPGIMFSDEMTEQFGYDTAHELLAHPEPPTAFLSSSTISAFGIRRAADEAGLRLGRDLSIITHDDDLSYFVNGGEEPIFTALRSSVHSAGLRAARMLMRRISEPDALHTTELLEVDFVIGRSTGPVPCARVRNQEQRESFA